MVIAPTFRVKQKLKSSRFLNHLKYFKVRKQGMNLVVSMLASGTEDGQVKIRSKKMGKDGLEKALRMFQGKTALIMIGCDAGYDLDMTDPFSKHVTAPDCPSTTLRGFRTSN